MDMKPTLLVLAAGMGSRYGGLKQMDGLGPSGETIIDYSIYDAVAAGFGRVLLQCRSACRRSHGLPCKGPYGVSAVLPVTLLPGCALASAAFDMRACAIRRTASSKRCGALPRRRPASLVTLTSAIFLRRHEFRLEKVGSGGKARHSFVCHRQRCSGLPPAEILWHPLAVAVRLLPSVSGPFLALLP